jgi:hypothetical protein
VRRRTTFRVSVKVASALPKAIAPTPSGPSAVSVASACCLMTSNHAAMRKKYKAWRLVRPRAVSRRYFMESVTVVAILRAGDKIKSMKSDFFHNAAVDAPAVDLSVDNGGVVGHSAVEGG